MICVFWQQGRLPAVGKQRHSGEDSPSHLECVAGAIGSIFFPFNQLVERKYWPMACLTIFSTFSLLSLTPLQCSHPQFFPLILAPSVWHSFLLSYNPQGLRRHPPILTWPNIRSILILSPFNPEFPMPPAPSTIAAPYTYCYPVRYKKKKLTPGT